MKKVLFILGLVLCFTGVKAAGTHDLPRTNRYHQRSLQFVARGVEFVIFKNGEFDFNTHPMRYTRNRRSGYNATYGAPRTYGYRNPSRGVRIEHDYYGRVRRIGNTFINYDRIGRVKRIGTVYISYNYRGLAKQIGGLHIYYTPRGRIAYTRGHIMRNNGHQWHTWGNTNNDDEWEEVDTDYNDQDYGDEDADDEDIYYYKQSPKKEKKKAKR